MVTDLAGFVASTYMRGVNLVHIPTTLLGVIDAAIGGKTAVNLKGGKNLVGTFYQPKLVVADVNFFKTLSDDEYKNGVCEGIKYGILQGDNISQLLESGLSQSNIQQFCKLCIEYKADIVQRDEFEGGARRLLNLGHTFGHAIELLSNFTLSHGECVAKGIMIIAKAALKRKTLPLSDFERIQNLFLQYSIDTTCPFSKEELLQAVKHDKKGEENSIFLVTINAIGNCSVEKMTLDELAQFIDGCIE